MALLPRVGTTPLLRLPRSQRVSGVGASSNHDAARVLAAFGGASFFMSNPHNVAEIHQFLLVKVCGSPAIDRIGQPSVPGPSLVPFSTPQHHHVAAELPNSRIRRAAEVLGARIGPCPCAQQHRPPSPFLKSLLVQSNITTSGHPAVCLTLSHANTLVLRD